MVECAHDPCGGVPVAIGPRLRSCGARAHRDLPHVGELGIQDVPAVLERLNPLGLGAQRGAWGTQQERFFLQTAGVSNHAGGTP